MRPESPPSNMMESEDSAHAAHESIEKDALVASTTLDIDHKTNDPSNEPDAEMSDANNDDSDDDESDGDAERVAKPLPGEKSTGGKKEAVSLEKEIFIQSDTD